jgi:hypothetical protein
MTDLYLKFTDEVAATAVLYTQEPTAWDEEGNVTLAGANISATTAASATFATSSLPLVLAGYISILLNGTTVKIPYYAV